MSYNNERDDFWDIEKLVPKTKSKLSKFSTRQPTASYKADAPDPTTEYTDSTTYDLPKEQRRLDLSAYKGVDESEPFVYEPKNSLIKRVTVKKYIDKYDFYDNFRKSALLYFDVATKECPFAQFYSYMPQYSQLTRPQRDYYFYWRSELRRGRYIKTDYSYLYLYVYEILNLPDKIPPEKGVRLLIDLWREYRQSLPRIDYYFSIWLQDYCLVHGLEAPTGELSDFIFDVISLSGFKEFYLSDITAMTRKSVYALVGYLSDYDPRQSRLAKEGDTELYSKHLDSALSRLMSVVWHDCMRDGLMDNVVTVTRDAFPSSLCTRSVKSKLTIEYLKLSDSDTLRRAVTASVRYIENKLRALIGVKSRISVKDLPSDYKEIIDSYFDALIEDKKKKEIQRNIPAYERFYDAPSEKLSTSGADEIEAMSWSTTARIVDGIEEYEEEPTPEEPQNTIDITEDSKITDAYGLTTAEITVLRSLFRDGTVDCALLDSVAEHINEAFSDNFGDVILEFDGEKYTPIEDYREDVLEWLKKTEA